MAFRSVNPWQGLLLIPVLCTVPMSLKAEVKKLLTPEACTGIRYLTQDDLTSRPLVMSPDSRTLAYVVQVQDITSNDYRDELFVAPMTPDAPAAASSVLASQLIANVHWFPDSRHLAALTTLGNKVVLTEIDSINKTRTTIWEANESITDYSIDAAGRTIAIAVRVSHAPQPKTPQDDRAGYRIDFSSTVHSDSPKRRVYILHRTDDHHWEMVERISFSSPLSGRMIDEIEDAHDMHISLSPDGRFLLMDNLEAYSGIPVNSSWERSRLVRYMEKRGIVGLIVSYLYDLQTHQVSMPLNSPTVRDGRWAPDSKSYLKIALAPVESTWETADLEKGTPNDHMTHLFSVDVTTGKVSEVLNRAEAISVAAWTHAGSLIVRDSSGAIFTLREESDQWRQRDTTEIPFSDADPYSSVASDGQSVVLEYQSAHVAPRIEAFDLASHKSWTVVNLNPQVNSLILPKTEPITWKTSTGFVAKGLLLLPPDYDPRRRYPLVIENGSILYSGEFVCDSGIAHVSSFARGILADAGIAYLMREWPGIDQWESDYYPKGYPGALAEAVFKQDLIESAVRALDQRQIIDPTKIGLIGFSRGGWYVEYTLAHSHFDFQAATATDNIQYSMGEYWYWNNESMANSQEGIYGGPPYGQSLKNWIDYSISFNLDRINTPLLMEVMGYGKKYEDPDHPPDNLAVHNEIFVGLSRLNKAVEYYYYPDEQHEPKHPQARIASLQRNVDWYRFWLQGYERPGPVTVEQYKRWEHWRQLRDAARSKADPTVHAGLN